MVEFTFLKKVFSVNALFKTKRETDRDRKCGSRDSLFWKELASLS